MMGKGKLTLTGQLGDVMKESATLEGDFVRANADDLGVESDFNDKSDIHVHVPAEQFKRRTISGSQYGNLLVSLLTGVAVKEKVAMTGEITLRGNVLPIGGVKEKVTAAHRSGIKEVILPDHNKKDLEDVPSNVAKDMIFHFAKEIKDVLKVAILILILL